MPVKFKFENLNKGAWVLLRQVPNLVSRCEDQVFSKHGLTTERHAVLMAIRQIDDPVRPTDVARWLDLSVNSVSMIIDRMVKAGLVKRTRDRKDRRTVFLAATDKAQKAYVLASVARDKTYDYLGSGEVAEEVERAEMDNMARLMKQAAKHKSLSTPEAKRRGSRKRKTVR